MISIFAEVLQRGVYKSVNEAWQSGQKYSLLFSGSVAIIGHSSKILKVSEQKGLYFSKKSTIV
jgi:hypothetical protein